MKIEVAVTFFNNNVYRFTVPSIHQACNSAHRWAERRACSHISIHISGDDSEQDKKTRTQAA